MQKEKKLESAKQNKIISRSEFLPNLTISGNQTIQTQQREQTKMGQHYRTLILIQKPKKLL